MAMATYEPMNSNPTIWYPGTEDKSGRAIPSVLPTLPAHIPTFFTFARKGPLVAQRVSGSTALELFGDDLFNVRGKLATIATPFMFLMNKYANPMIIQRVVPETAADKANFILAVEMLRTEAYKEYRTIDDGTARSINADANINFEDDTAEEGIYLQWHLIPVESAPGRADEITDWNRTWAKLEAKTAKKLRHIDDTGTTSRLFPVFGLKAKWIGEYANNIGIRLYTDESNLASHVLTDQKAVTYRLEVVERESATELPSVVPTLNGERYVQFSFKEGAVNSKAGDLSLELKDVLVDNFAQRGTATRPEKFSPFDEVHVFHEDIEELLTECLEVECSAHDDDTRFGTADDPRGRSVDLQHITEEDKNDPEIMRANAHLINFVSGKDSTGRYYKRIFVRDLLGNPDVLTGESNTAVGKDVVHYLQGGFDGFTAKELKPAHINKVYDDLVRQEFKNFGVMNSNFLDLGRYPLRQFYDVGFTTATKAHMLTLLTKRQDVNVTLSTVDLVNNDQSTEGAVEEASIGAVLRAQALGYFESEMFGTGVMRALIIPADMKANDFPRYKKTVPMTYEIARMRAQYMGRPDGFIMGRGYDNPPYNHVMEGYNVSNVYANAAVRENNYWANGMSYFIHKTDNTVFCPGLRTLYVDETSVLTSDITMQIVCDINYICFQVWTELTGNSQLNDAEFMAKSDALIAQRVEARYDGRVVVVPRTFKDEKDQAQGYSWSCNVALYANNMRTVLKSWVTTYRMEDLNG